MCEDCQRSPVGRRTIIKVSITTRDYAGCLDIVFWDERDGKIFAAKPCPLVWEEVKDGYITEPTLKISRMLSGEFMKAVAEELERHNVKTDSDARVHGTLDATRYHLEDLRKLLKLSEGEKK